MKLSNTMMSFNDYIRPGKMTVAEFIDISAGYGLDAVDLLEYSGLTRKGRSGKYPGNLMKEDLELLPFVSVTIL